MDWKREIAVAHLIKQEIAEVDDEGLWEQHYPAVAASPSEIKAVEAQLGFSLTQPHREFLAHADGWRGFFQTVDVFGVKDLVAGPLHARAAELLGSLGDTLPLCGVGAAELLPFAVSSADIDLFAIARPDSAQPGTVFWFAGGLVDQFPCFGEWFLAMNDYNREEYTTLKTS